MIEKTERDVESHVGRGREQNEKRHEGEIEGRSTADFRHRVQRDDEEEEESRKGRSAEEDSRYRRQYQIQDVGTN